MKIGIIGAGPIGCYIGMLLAKDHDVKIFDMKEKIGLPVRCTGLLSKEISHFKIDDKIILNRIENIKVKSKNQYVNFKLKKKELVLCRASFDEQIYNLAKKNNVKFFFNKKFIEFKNNIASFETNKKNELFKIKFDFLIGADGPNSKVRNLINKNKTKNWIAIQSDVINKKDVEKDTFEVYLGEEFKDFFGWKVPVNDELSRVGFASKKRNLEAEKKLKIKNLSGGLIPVYNPNLVVIKNNIALVGDAATHVKATTGGGLIQGLNGALEIYNIINNKNIRNNNQIIKNKNLKLHKTLKLHLLLRNILNEFSDKDYDYLLKLCNQNKIKKIISENDREKPLKMILKIILKEPKFLKYGKYLFNLVKI